MGDLIQTRREDLETRLVEGELVILDLRSQRYLSLNRTGTALWPLMVEGIARSQLVDALALGHDISLDVAERDVDVLIGQLRDADLLAAETDAHAPNG